jgi:hypothetical protein
MDGADNLNRLFLASRYHYEKINPLSGACAQHTIRL